MEKNELMPLMFTTGGSRLDAARSRSVQSRRAVESRQSTSLGKACGEIRGAADAGFLDSSRMSRPAQSLCHASRRDCGGAYVLTDPAELDLRQVDGSKPRLSFSLWKFLRSLKSSGSLPRNNLL